MFLFYGCAPPPLADENLIKKKKRKENSTPVLSIHSSSQRKRCVSMFIPIFFSFSQTCPSFTLSTHGAAPCVPPHLIPSNIVVRHRVTCHLSWIWLIHLCHFLDLATMSTRCSLMTIDDVKKEKKDLSAHSVYSCQEPIPCSKNGVFTTCSSFF